MASKAQDTGSGRRGSLLDSVLLPSAEAVTLKEVVSEQIRPVV